MLDPEQLDWVLQHLPKQDAILLQAIADGDSHATLAQRYQITVAGVRQRLQKARTGARSLLAVDDWEKRLDQPPPEDRHYAEQCPRCGRKGTLKPSWRYSGKRQCYSCRKLIDVHTEGDQMKNDVVEQVIDQMLGEPPMLRPKIKLGTRMKTIPMNQDDDPDGFGMGSKVTGLQVADRLAQADDLILSMRFIVSNDEMSRDDLVRIKDRASRIIGQATEILNSCNSRLARREHN